MALGEARRSGEEMPSTRGPGPSVSFDWRGCAAHLETTSHAIIAQIERFLALTARNQERLPPNSEGSVVTVLNKDRGSLVRTNAWQAWAAGQDQLIYLILEALGQVFVDGYPGAVFHAGAFDLGRGAIIVHGPALSGKTTLVYRAWRRGCAVLSADRIALGAGYETVQPFPRCLKLRCDSDDEAAALAEGLPAGLVAKATVGNERRVILARALPGFAAYDASLPIRALVQVERATDQTRLEPIEPSAALEVALRNIVSSDFNPTAVVRLIKSQAVQHRLYRLAIGPRQTDAALDLLGEL